MKRTTLKKLTALLLVFVFLLSGNGFSTTAASRKYVKSLKLSKTKVSLKKGNTTKINATVKTVGKAKMSVNVKSASKSVAKVKAGKTSKKGITPITITAVNAGKTTITVTTKDKAKNKKVMKKTLTVTVKNKSSEPAKDPAKPGTPSNTNPSGDDPSGDDPSGDDPSTPSTDNPSGNQPISDKVEWKVTEEQFMGAYSSKNEVTGEIENIPKELTRKYVSFNPWPTTNEQITYVIKNCNDPYVVASLYIVALDNFVYNGLGNYSGEVYKMLNTLMSGANTVTGSNYQLSNFAKQQICGFGNKKALMDDGTSIDVSSFATRAYLKGATPYNNYTPEGGLTDKTKWQISMDEYVYCGDLANGYITVCPQRYTESQETDGGEKTVVEHWQGIRIGMRWNKNAQVWLPTDNTSLNSPPTGSLVPFNVEKQVLFSSNYMPPKPDQGW